MKILACQDYWCWSSNQVHLWFCERNLDLNCVQSINIHDVNKMLKKDLSCFYCLCFNCNYKDCMNLAWTNTWQVEILNMNNSWYVQNVIQATTHEDEWDQFRALLEFMIYQTKKINKKKTHFEQPPKRSSSHFGHIVSYTSNMAKMVLLTTPRVAFFIGHFDSWLFDY
jgi:hypothetical protein